MISPQPEPPSLDPGQITIELISTNPDGTEIDSAVVNGTAGAAMPGGATVRIINLDRSEEAREVSSEADGSFTVVLGATPGDELRLRAFAEGQWSRPVDIVAPAESGPAERPSRPLEDCFLVRAPAEVSFGNVAVGDIAVEVITIENECDQPAEIGGVWLRVGNDPTPDCEVDYEQCVEGVPPEDMPPDDDPFGCFEALSGCEESCSRELEECYGSADSVPEDCDRMAVMCSETCQASYRDCRVVYCEEEILRCGEIPYAEPQGFTVLHGSLPMIVPSGSSRSVVVTFAPQMTGPAEDALLVEVVSPETERRPITLTGTGVSG